MALGKWIESCWARMPSKQPADAAKKPKQVGNSDNANSRLLPVAESGTLQHMTIGMAHDDLLAQSAAAQLFASLRSSTPSTLANPRRVAWADRSGGPVARLARPSGRSHSAAERSRTFAPDIARSSDAPLFDDVSGSRLHDADTCCDTDTYDRDDTHAAHNDAANCTHPPLPLLTPSDAFHAILDAPNHARTRPNSFLTGRRPPQPTTSPFSAIMRGINRQPSPRNLSRRCRPARNSGRLTYWRRCSRAIRYGRHSPSALPKGRNSPSSTSPTTIASRTSQLAWLAAIINRPGATRPSCWEC